MLHLSLLYPSDLLFVPLDTRKRMGVGKKRSLKDVTKKLDLEGVWCCMYVNVHVKASDPWNSRKLRFISYRRKNCSLLAFFPPFSLNIELNWPYRISEALCVVIGNFNAYFLPIILSFGKKEKEKLKKQIYIPIQKRSSHPV